MDVFSRFVRLSHRASTEEVIELLGEPEDEGRGQRGYTLFAYNNLQLQVAFKWGRVDSVVGYFEPLAVAPTWPSGITIPPELSGQMTEIEVIGWLERFGYRWRRELVAGNPYFIAADGGLQLVVVGDYLRSIRVLDI